MGFTEKVTQKYDHYYKYQEISDLLHKYAKKFPQYTKLDVIGTTPEGRDILLLEVTNTKTGDFSDKPAFYVEGNLHAGEVTGCMTCMYFLDVLFTNIENEEVQKTLNAHTIYVLPRVSPDGSEYYLTTPDSVRSAPRFYPYIEEMPGLQPADLDGDGVIRRMRVKTPYGIWKKSSKDPRVMTKRKPDDIEGEFYNVYQEGTIVDFDGINIKSAPGKFGLDFNRNYPLSWEPEHKQRGAGSYPLCNPETLANAKFLMSHKNVCAAIDMHTSGGQILYTPGCKPSKDCEKQDIDIYKALGKMGHEENGFPVINVYDEYGMPGQDVTFGGFDDFCHMNIGIPCFTIECWDHAHRAGVEEHYPPIPETDEMQEENTIKYLNWMDKEYEGKGFKNWERFNHPQLGEVEIGGFDYKRYIQNPPVKDLPQEVEKHTRFFFRELNALPNVKFTKFETTKIASDVYKLEAYVGNVGYLPTYVFKEGVKFKTLEELTVSISGCEVIDGKESTKIGHLEGFSGASGMNGCYGPMTMQFNPSEKKITWIIKASVGTKLNFEITGGRIGKIKANYTI